MFEVLTPQEIRDYARELGIFNLILELNFSEFYKLYKNNPGALEAILLICSPAARLINAIQNGYTYLDQKLSGGLTALALLTILPLSFGAIGAFANQQYVSLNQVLCCSTVIGLCTFSLMSAIHYPLSMLHDYLVQRMPNREEMINDIKHIILLTPALIASPALMLCLANKAFTYNVESTGGYMAIEVVKHIGKQFLDFNSVIFSSLAETTLSTGQAVQFAAEEYGSTACQVVAAAAIAYCSARALGLEIALNR